MPTPDTCSSPVYVIDTRPPAAEHGRVADFIDQCRQAREPLTVDGYDVEDSMPLSGIACSSFDGLDFNAVRQDALVILGMCPPGVAALSLADTAPDRPISAGLWFRPSDDSPILEWRGCLAIAEDVGLLIVAKDGSAVRIGATHVEFLPRALAPGAELEAGLVRAIDAWTTWRRTAGNA